MNKPKINGLKKNLFLTVSLIFLLAQNGFCQEVAKAENNGETDIKDLVQKFNKPKVKIGVKEGTVYDKLSEELFPLAKKEYYLGAPDMMYQVANGKLDFYISDEPTIRYAMLENDKVTYIKTILREQYYSFGFPKTAKGQSLCSQINEFLAKLENDGTLKELDSIWFGQDETKKVIDFPPETGKNGTLQAGIDLTLPPFTYIKDNKYAGYEVDIISRFCKEYGYGLKIYDVKFSSLLVGIAANVYDIGMGMIAVTPERAENMYFSEPDYKSGAVLVVKNNRKNATINGKLNQSEYHFSSKIGRSFEKTFIREQRWRLILHGIGITVLISIFSAIFGTILGFGICMMRLSKKKALDVTALVYIRLMQGTPILVLLMILFYIVFSKTGLSGMWVSVIAFSMNFGAYVSEMMRIGIKAVDKGQTEAALSLGYTKEKAFFKIVFPQAAQHFLPVYQGEFISLVKMTSVVGYIAVQDLTKASDIIRSRTYDAFFPLITTAIIYFLIAFLLTRALTALQKFLNPKTKNRKRGKKYE